MNTSLTKIQELELLSALESRAESPLKFAYIGKGHKWWIEMARKSRENHEIQFKEDLLKRESLPFIFRSIDSKTKIVNIIDFGCGDGVPIMPIFNYLKSITTISTVRYISVDISRDMLAVAEKTIKNYFPKIEIISILFDFERGEVLEKLLQLSKVNNTKNYFFLLGNTLGNFDNTEKVLSNLKLSMFSDDQLIIGNQVSNVLAAPKLVEYYHRKEVFNIVSSTLKNYGMNCSFKEYNVRWNDIKKHIEMFLSLEKDRKIIIAGQSVYFEKGEEILLAISKKFIEESIVEVFNHVGFRIELFTTNKKKDTCIISVAPSRYKP